MQKIVVSSPPYICEFFKKAVAAYAADTTTIEGE